MYIIAKSKKDAEAQVRKLNREHKYGYKLIPSTLRYKGKARTAGYKTYTVRKALKTDFEQYGKR